MLRLLILLSILCFFLPNNSQAIGGDRRGFTLGIGMGYSPIIYYRHTNGFDDFHSGLLTTLVIGRGFDNRNALVLEGTSSFWSIGQRDYFMNSTSIRWYHYFKDNSKSRFTSLGIGAISLVGNSNTPKVGFLLGVGEDVAGLGVSLGTGYEVFSRGLLELRLGAGYGSNFWMLHAGVMFTYMGY